MKNVKVRSLINLERKFEARRIFSEDAVQFDLKTGLCYSNSKMLV